MKPGIGRGGRQAGAAGPIIGLVLFVVCVGPGAAAVFDVPPTLGDRRVELTWQPDADDPVYNGNTILEISPRWTTIHAAGRAVRSMVSSGDGSTIYSVAAGENVLRGWNVADGVVTVDLPLGSGDPVTMMPVALTMHSSDIRILGARSNGDLCLWRLDRPGPPQVIPGGTGMRALRFFPGLRDTSALSFVSVGVDDTVRVWSAPGQLLGRGYVIPIVGGATDGFDITTDRKLIAVGTQTGEVRVYNIETPPDTPMLRLTGHGAAVTGLTFSRGRRKLASVDQNGRVCIWKIPEGTLLATAETGAAAPAVSLSPPDGKILMIMTADGRIEVRSGDTGMVYRAEPVMQPPGAREVTQSILAGDGVRTVVGDDDGGITVVQAGDCRPGAGQPSCFGGYMIWRGRTTKVEDQKLLRIYNYSDSTWTFAGGVRAFSDPDSIIARKNPRVPGQEPMDDFEVSGPPNGVPYYYSVTRFDVRYFEGGVFPVFPDSTVAVWNGFFRDLADGPPTAIVAEAIPRSEPPFLGSVIVVPNPYEAGKVPWEQSGEMHVEFRNLPETATIRIYTLAGDLVRVLEHGRGRYQELRDASAWDLRNSSGRRVTSGVYVYQVETKAGNGLPGEVAQGYFTVVF